MATTTRTQELAQAVGRAVALLEETLARDLSGPEAVALAEVCAGAARRFEAAMAVAARTVEATEAFGLRGFRDGAEWLAATAGESKTRAQGLLTGARRLGGSGALEAAYRAGRLSRDQMLTVTDAVALAPAAAPALLEAARTEPYAELRRRCLQEKAWARSAEAQHAQDARAHARRRLRESIADDGAARVTLAMTRADWGRCKVHLEARADDLFREARRRGETPAREQLMLDALVSLVCARGRGDDRSDAGPNALCILRVDAAALRRGALEPGEICEIDGVGPISVPVGRALLGDALFHVLVHDGVDVRTVTGRQRSVPSHLRVALVERDRRCVVPGCDVARGLEIDHWRADFAAGGPTALDNLARLCGHHHALKTYGGWILGGGPGAWTFEPPPVPPGPEQLGRARRAAAARAQERKRRPPGPSPPAAGPR